MANINESNNSITLFYSKSTGDIIQFCTGVQDMSIYGDFRKDYEMAFDYTVVPYDDLLINNTKLFCVDLNTKNVKFKQGLNKYI